MVVKSKTQLIKPLRDITNEKISLLSQKLSKSYQMEKEKIILSASDLILKPIIQHKCTSNISQEVFEFNYAIFRKVDEL